MHMLRSHLGITGTYYTRLLYRKKKKIVKAVEQIWFYHNVICK